MRSRGFTLIEVLVALLVVALALPALFSVLSKQIDGTAHLRDKAMANWVASNQLAEIRLLQYRQNQVLQGKRSGVVSQGGRDWFWWTEHSPTEVEDFFRVEIRVATREDAENAPLHTLVAFTAARGVTDAP